MMDVTALEPFSKARCASCHEEVRVRTAFHQYQITREVGLGGMSRVLGARDLSLGRELALKILSPSCSRDGKRLRQFEKEARITASISHPNVVKVYTAGRDQGYFYIAMELVEGGSLDDRIRTSGRLPEDWVLHLAEYVVQGLKAASDAGLIHRDIKPGNILLTKAGSPKIVDFGLAIFARDGVEDSEIWATPFYVPPETLHGEPEDFRSDIYALGSTLYHALVGKPLFDNDTNSLHDLKQLKSRPPDLREAAALVSQETAAILTRTLKRKPSERYGSYGEFLDHLGYARRRLRRGGKGTPWPGRPALTTGQRRAVAAAAAAAVMAGGVWYAVHSRAPGPVPENGEMSGVDLTVGSDSNVSSKFLKARDLVYAGAFLQGRSQFDALAEDAATLQPTRNWARFQAGLASLLAGDLPGARLRFKTILQAGPFADEPEHTELAKFFANSAALLESDVPVAPARTGDFPPNSLQAIGLFAVGLKNWHLGDLAGAAAFLKAFGAATPPRSGAWVDRYKTLAEPYLAELRLVDSMPSLPLAAKTPEQADALLEKAKSTAVQITHPGAAADAAARRVADIASAVAEFQNLHKDVLQGKAAEELRQILAVEAASAPLADQMEFDTIAAKLRALTCTTPAGRQALTDHHDLWENATTFLELLRQDLVQPLEGDLDRQAGPFVHGIISDAPTGLRVLTGSGAEIILPVHEIKPASLTLLAERVLARTADSDAYYTRREMLVAFALRSGLKNYAILSGRELARENRPFRARWARLQALGMLE